MRFPIVFFMRVEAKTNEIKGIPDLLDWLDLRGAVVTTDAIGCQKDITKILLGKGADFVLPVKDNQANLHKDILKSFRVPANSSHIFMF